MTDLDTLGIVGAVVGALGAAASLGVAFFKDRRQVSSLRADQQSLDVVLSFASSDAPFAEMLAKDLRTNRLRVWPKNPEESIDALELEANASDSRYGVVIVSRATLDAGPSAKELKPFFSPHERPKLFEVRREVGDDELRETVAAGLAPQLTLSADELTVKEIADAITAIVAPSPET